MKEKIAKIHAYMPVVIIAAIVAFGFTLYDMRVSITRIENMIAHLEEETHDAGVGVNRLLKRGSADIEQKSSSGLLPIVKLDKTEFDFGVIEKKDGVVNTSFIIKNDGEGKLVIGDMTTSCSCTTVKADKSEATTDDSIKLTVIFDPNFHEEPQGRFSRSVFVPTNDPDNKEIEFKIFAEIKN